MNTPRLLPLVGVALGGVLILKIASGAGALPDLFGGAKAFAEGVVKPATSPAKPGDPAAAKASSPLPPGFSAAAGPQASSSLVPPGGQPAAAAPPRLACGANAADLAREAGLSPAELQILQSLGSRRGELDQREQDVDAQAQLIAAAEAKLDAKLAALAAMKSDIQGLITQADQQSAAEIDRLVIVYSQMKPRDAAARMSLLDDSVRLPIAAKMKERALSAIMGQMAPADAKALTEKLAARLETKALADARAAISGAQPPAAPAQPPAAASAVPAKPSKVAKAPARRKAKPEAVAAAGGSTPAKAAPAAPAPAKSG